jgi:hypothetical protein
MLYMILYSMLYNMLYNTIYKMLPLLICFWQDCVCLIAPYPNNAKPVDQFDFATDMDLSGEGLLWYARTQLFFHCTVAPTGSLHHDNTGRHRQLALVFFKECPCSTTVPATLTCLAFLCAGLRTCLVVCQWCCALWLETAHPPCLIDLATVMELLPIPARGGATEVGCTSSTSGCGGMGGTSHSMSLWQKLSRGARNERVMLDDGQWRR